MGWRDAQSLEQLKKLGTLKEISRLIEGEFENLKSIKVPKNSWGKLWELVISIKDLSQDDVVDDEGGLEYNKIRSLEELKSLGGFKEVKNSIQEQMNGQRIKAKSWQELYEFILISNKQQDKSNRRTSYESSYFKDEVSEVIFYLLELEGDIKFGKLGITKLHFKDKEKALYWKRDLMKKIHPDQSTHVYAEEATKELNKLYGSMIKFAK